MTSEEMTTGSVRATEQERKLFAQQTRWWNSTGGGTRHLTPRAASSNTRGVGAIKSGDGGANFRLEWPELDEENLKWMAEKKIDLQTGLPKAPVEQPHCLPDVAGLRRRPNGSTTGVGAVVHGGQQARDASQSWLSRNRWKVLVGAVFAYIMIARMVGDGAMATPN
jgi:ubiquitin-conjugating enzyme E2 J2